MPQVVEEVVEVQIIPERINHIVFEVPVSQIPKKMTEVLQHVPHEQIQEQSWNSTTGAQVRTYCRERDSWQLCRSQNMRAVKNESRSRFWVFMVHQIKEDIAKVHQPAPQGHFWQRIEKQIGDLLVSEIKEALATGLRLLPQKLVQEPVAKEMAAHFAPSIVECVCVCVCEERIRLHTVD